MQGPWDDYSSAPSGESSPGGLTRLTPPKAPDPAQVAKDARSENRADTNTGLSVQSGERSAKDQVQGFRKEFTSRPEYRTYGISMQSLSNAIGRAPDASGDASLIYDWAKAMDPDSVVRESEVGLAQTGQAMIESAAARMKKELGYQEGGLLDPKNRERLIREIITAAKSRRKAYEQQRDYYTGIAERNQFNPEDVVGPHLGEPFREDLSHFGVSGRKFSDEEMAARKNGAPSVVGAPPIETITQPGGEREARDDTSLEPGQQWAYDGDGNRIGILNPDGSWNSGFGSIVDDVSAREAEDKIKTALDGDQISMVPGIEKGASWNWSDEYRGLQSGIESLVTEGDFGKGYTERRDLERAAQRLSREEHGILPELGGSLATAFVPLGTAATATKMMGQGAAIGAIAGAGEGEGLRDTTIKTAIGSGVGGATGGVISQVPKVARALTRNKPMPDQAVIQAGERQGIPIRLPDAVPSKSREFAVLESSPNQGQRVADALASDVEAFGNRVAGIAPGRPLEPLPRGDMVQKAGKRYLARTRQEAGDFYKTAERLGADETVDAAHFIQDVDARIASLKADGEDANSGIISLLEGMKRDLSKGLTVGRLQAQRKTMRSRLDKAGLTLDGNQAQLTDALSVAADALKGGLSKPAAREALEKADAFYADRQSFVDGVLKHFSDRKGNIGPETAAKRFDQFLKEGGNFRVAQKMFDELEPEERLSIATTAAQSLGRNEKGDFTLPTFIKDVSGKTPKLSRRAQFLLFGKDGVRAIRDLELIAKAKTASESGFNRSRSNTTFQGATGFRLRDSLMSMLGLGGAVSAGGDTIPALVAGGVAYGASRGASKLSDARKASLFLNPKFTTWLRNAPDSDEPAVINKYLDQLNKIASRDQAFLMDAQAIRSFVADQLSKGTGRAAAEDKSTDDRRK